MEIAFWSNVRHLSGVTAGVVAISVLWTALYTEDIAITANHVSNSGVMECMRGGTERWEKLARREYCYTYGEPEYFRILYNKGEKPEIKLNSGMSYIPMHGGQGAQMFSGGGLSSVRRQAGKNKCLIVDTACGCGSNSMEILREAEVSVVTLPPEKHLVDAFFQSDTFLTDKSFFILGNYKKEASYSPAILARKFRIAKERIGVIPYDPEFEQAMRAGDTVAYLAGNMNCGKRDKAYHFMSNTKNTAVALRKYALERRYGVFGGCEEV